MVRSSLIFPFPSPHSPRLFLPQLRFPLSPSAEPRPTLFACRDDFTFTVSFRSPLFRRQAPATTAPAASRPTSRHPARPTHYKLLDRPGSLAPLLAALNRVDEVFLDTEADNMFHYKVRLCLLQFYVDGEVYLVDALAPELDLTPLWDRLAQVHLVMHGSDFDLRLLHDRCGFRAKSIFDTMLAAQLLGRQRIGLAALLEEHFGITADKSGQKANWSRRPIVPKLLDYAALDVWHLPGLRDILTRGLADLDRLEWLDQQCRAQIQAGTEGFAPATEHDWRIGRSERLRGLGQPVLHAIWHWRETTAEQIDTPPFKVCNNDLLLDIAYAAEDGQTAEAILTRGSRQTPRPAHALSHRRSPPRLRD